MSHDRGERGGVAEILRSKIIRDRVPDRQHESTEYRDVTGEPCFSRNFNIPNSVNKYQCRMSEEYKNNHYVPIWYQKRFVLDPATDTELQCDGLKTKQF